MKMRYYGIWKSERGESVKALLRCKSASVVKSFLRVSQKKKNINIRCIIIKEEMKEGLQEESQSLICQAVNQPLKLVVAGSQSKQNKKL